MSTTLNRFEEAVASEAAVATSSWICTLPRSVCLPSPVDGLLFDACNILYDDTCWRRWLLRLLTRFGVAADYWSFFRDWDRDYAPAVHCGRRSFFQALAAYLLSLGLSPGEIEEVQAACQSQRRHFQDDLRPLTGAVATLERLYQSGLLLAVICNSEQSGDALRQWLDRFALGQCFTAVISSIDLGQAMPNPAAYRAALHALELPAERMAFVGHKGDELSGAAALGMSTIAFNSDIDALADVYLDRFEDLAKVASRRLPCAAAG